MLVRKASELNQLHGVKAIIYGGSGVGKTSQIKTLVKAGYKPLVLSAEGGLLSIGNTEVDVIDITKDEKGEMVKPEERFNNIVKAYDFVSKSKNYDTIVLDSLTEINQVLMDYLRTKYPDAKNTLQMYGENALVMQKMIKKFRDLPINVVLIALDSIEKDDTGRRFVTMDLIGKVASNVPPLFDEVLYMFADENGQRKFVTNKTDKITAKDRSGKLSPVEEADLGMILNKIKQ